MTAIIHFKEGTVLTIQFVEELSTSDGTVFIYAKDYLKHDAATYPINHHVYRHFYRIPLSEILYYESFERE